MANLNIPNNGGQHSIENNSHNPTIKNSPPSITIPSKVRKTVQAIALILFVVLIGGSILMIVNNISGHTRSDCIVQNKDIIRSYYDDNNYNYSKNYILKTTCGILEVDSNDYYNSSVDEKYLFEIAGKIRGPKWITTPAKILEKNVE